ncbi:MAG: copper-translocating P-type ATPase [Fimbriimonadaceae bacterium]|nr:MAG: copper-translocating P-type ATPase [Fimbriimonadaceae bacterium]
MNHGPHSHDHRSHDPSAHDHPRGNRQELGAGAPKPDQPTSPDPSSAHGHAHGHHGSVADPIAAEGMERDLRRRFFVALLLSVPVTWLSGHVPGLPSPLPNTGHLAHLALFTLTTPVVLYSGWIFLAGAASALRSRTLDMSVLIATGVVAAYGASVYLSFTPGSPVYYEAAAMLVAFVLFGHWMEMKSRRGTSNALRALFDLVPPSAVVLHDGEPHEMPTSEVQVGDLILVKPGEKVPVDGEVIEGQSAVDEALVTGESVPVEKSPGEAVIGGSVNTTGALTVRATKVGADTVLSHITKLVETAQNSKAPGQRLADRAAAYLVVLAVGSGILTFALWTLAGAEFVVALTFSISAVVIACPDALGLATPTAVAVGIGLGARHNVLIKDAVTLEQTAKVETIVVDKTGTLTEGRPRVTDVVAAHGASESDLVKYAAAAETQSSHPLALSIVDAARERGLQLPKVEDFENVTGLGLSARVEGKEVLVGRRKLLEDRGVDLTGVEAVEAQLEGSVRTLMYVSMDSRFEGVLAAADPIKPTSQRFVDEVKEHGLEVVLVTGDNQATADAVAQELGIERVFAEVLPAQKAEFVKRLQGEGKFVAMVGDGINDAPALAQANIGIAIGAGTDVAIEAADIVLMRSEPLDAVNAIILSRETVTKMKQNLVWASVYNVAAIPIAAGALYSSLGWSLRPEVSALLMSMSSVIVALNAVLLRRAEGLFVDTGSGSPGFLQ